ncbi:MAG: putative lipid II flippase FtsW [Acidobacteriota bacterium]
MPKKLSSDKVLFITTTVLSIFGILMVGSASYYVAMKQMGNSYHFLIRQIIFVLAGMLLLYLIMNLDYRIYKKKWFINIFLIVTSALLLFVLTMPPIHGTRRWFSLGFFSIQPSEFAKLAAIFFVAYWLELKQHRQNDLKEIYGPCLLVVGGMSLIIAIEPDFGTAFILLLISGIMFFLAGMRYKQITIIGAAGLAAMALMVATAPYRISRIFAYLSPDADPLGSGYQLNQSLIAIGSGGITGKHFGSGQQKAFFLPDPHTDFIYSVVGEEFGLIGAVLVVVAFLVLLWRGVISSARIHDLFGYYLGMGITSMIVVQAFLNIAVATGLVPTKGITLPFISYGGSSIIVNLIGAGILLNISQHSS